MIGAIQVSMVANAHATETKQVQLLALLRGIKDCRWLEKQKAIRAKREQKLRETGGDLKAAKLAIKKDKEALPGATFAGLFSYRANEKWTAPSGILPGDLDNLNSDLPIVREKLRRSPHLLFDCESVTGSGLRVLVLIPIETEPDEEKYHACFESVRQHVLDLCGVEIDPACKDPARLSFVSADRDARLNLEATPIALLPPKPAEPKPKAKAHPGGQSQYRDKPSKEQVREMLAAIPKRPEYYDWITVVAAVGDVLDLADAVEVLDEWSPEEEEGEYEKKLKSGFEKIHVGTLFHLAKQYGWTPLPKAKLTFESSEPVELPPPPTPYVPPPLDLLPSVLQDYVRAAAKSLNVDVSFILLPLLSALGSAIGNSRSIILKRGYVQPPVIWTGVISPTGSLKSPGLEYGSSPVLEHERELKRQNQQAQEQFEEDYAAWKNKKPKERGPEPEKPVILTCLMDDLTLEVLSDRLAANPRGVLIVKDEISHWFASFDQYKSGAKGSDVSRWLSLHTAVFLAVDRLKDNRHHRIWMPRACISGGIQPKVLRRVLTEEFFERGLPGRFLFAYPKTTQNRWSEETVSDELQNEVLKLFETLWLLQPEHDEHGQARPKLLRLDGEAKQIYVAFYNECGAAAIETDEHGAAAWNKLSGYAARLALVGMLARDPNAEIVTGEVMQAACDLTKWFGDEAIRIYAALAETPEQRERRELIEFVERRGGAVYERDVMQSFTRLKNNKLGTERELTGLVKDGLGNWEPVDHGGGPGRPARKFRLLRPSTSTQFGNLRGETGNSVDVDAPSSQKITPSEAPPVAPENAPNGSDEGAPTDDPKPLGGVMEL